MDAEEQQAVGNACSHAGSDSPHGAEAVGRNVLCGPCVLHHHQSPAPAAQQPVLVHTAS